MTTQKIYNRNDWWQAQEVVNGKTYTAWANTKEKAVADVVAQMEADGHIIKSPYTISLFN